MDVVSVDLDDTLISTKIEYEKAKDWFGDYVSSKFDIEYADAVDEYSHWSSELVDKYGLSKHRFPQAAVEALDSLLDESNSEVSEEHKSRVYDIGRSAFKSRYQYEEQGFIDEGVKDFLETVRDRADKSVLVTAGDPHIQNRKVDALDLREYFNRIEVVSMNGKTEILEEFTDAENLVHIGNSNHSDVKAASNADADCIYIPRGEWIDSSNEYEGDGSIHTVDSISEAEDILEKILEDSD